MNTYINKVFILLLMSFFTTTLHAQYNPESPAEPGAPILYYNLSLRATPSGAGTFNISTSTTQAEGASISLRANSSTSEYVFVAWTENDVVISTTSQFTYTMPAHHTELVAHFDYRPASPGEPSVPNIPVYSTLYFECSPSNSGTFNISSGNRYVVGTSVSITATNKTDFLFSHWTENDSTISTSKTLQYVVKEADAHLVAHFQYSPSNPAEPPVLQPTHRLTLQITPSSSGSLNISSGDYQPGTAISLKATAKTDYAFDAWLENDSVIATTASFTYTMPDRDVTLVARFKVSYNPSNPSEPVFPTDERHNIFGMTENALQGQRILYPVYLENTTPLMNMYIDLTFPDGFVVDTANCSLSDRCNGNWLEKILVEGNMWRMRVRGTNTFIGTNGNIMLIPVTVPDTAQMGKNYLVALSHGVIMRPDSTQIPVGVRSGYIYVTKTLEEGLYAKYAYEKLNGRVFFKNQSSDSAQTYIWEFGDGTFSTEFSPLHLYTNAGMYSVLLNSKGHVDTDIAEQTVIINDRDKWKLGGTYHLADSIASVRHFTSTPELLDFIEATAIGDDNVRIIGKPYTEHNMLLNDTNINILSHAHTLLSGNNFGISLTNEGSGHTVYSIGNANDSLTTDLITLFNNCGDITDCENATTELCGVEYNPWYIRRIPNQYIPVNSATSEIDLSILGPDLQYTWALADTSLLTSGLIKGCIINGTGNIPSMNIVNKTGHDVDISYQIQVNYGDWLFRRFTKTFTVERSPYEYVEPEYITLCYGDTCQWRDSMYVISGEYVDTIGNEISTLYLTILPEVPITNDSATICYGETYTWNSQTYSTEGEYSVTLQDINGCDSVAILHLTVNPVPTTEETITACDSYTWNDSTYTQSGDYTYTTVAANGCDSIVTLHLTINNSEIGATEYATICHGETYTWNGQTYSTEGEYSITLSNALGCDSVATLHLTIMPEAVTITETVVVGNDELPYTWRGNTYSATGRYTVVEQYTTVACDSAIHVLDLTVLTTGNHDEQSVTICETEAPYIWYGESYSATGKYTYTEKYVGTDIDSIQHILNLTVNPTVYTEKTITACDSYEWNGQTYTQSGDYTYTTVAANGCDSIVTLHLTISPTLTAEETITACDFYEWNGQTYTQSGDYTYTTTAANGCDSIVTLYLTINQTQYAEESVVACDSYDWNGQTYTQSGEYTYTTVAANGCDSIVTLHLTISPIQHADEYITACDSYEWNGQTYTQSGEYTYTTVAANGCDSIVTLQLTINQTQYAEGTVIACDSYAWNGQTYTQSGEYVYTTTAANGCDSIVTLHLTINQTQYAEESVIACDSYAWNGKTYTASGDYTYTTIAANGCDSIVTLHLTINNTQYAAESVVSCDSYTWNGQTYTESGDYTYTTVAANGCDSIVTLHLTINNSEIGATEYVTICYGETYTWNGQTYSTEGEYSITLSNTLGCDSVATLHLTIMPEAVTSTETIVIGSDELPYTWRGNTYSATGRYTVVEQYTTVACDSAIHILDLTVLSTGNYDEQSVTICETEAPYTWYGESYSATGKYTYTEKYIGTDIDSIQHILNLTVNPTVYTEEHITACDSYEWNGQTYTESGDYTYTTVAANGCDSIVTLHLTINNSEIGATEYVTICYGETYTWNGQTYSIEGEYSVTLSNTLGCDSVATLQLTIMPEATTTTETVVIGSDELPYTWRGNTYSATGRYTVVEQYTTVACDSAIYVLDLTVLTTGNYDEQSVTICDSEAPYLWYGESYSATGKYTYTEKYVGTDIDSIQHILNLTVNPTVYTEETITACDSYEWNGQTYTASGEYTYTTTAASGCDSIVTLHLTINQSEVGATEYATICYGETYTWNSQTYSTEGEYSITLSNALGCDSVATLHLTIMPEATTTTETVVIGSDELPYTWRGNTYSATGQYTVVEQYTAVACDSAIHVLDLTVLTIGNHDEQSATICDTEAPYIWYGESYSATGKYTYTEKYVGTDIDSIQHILNLTVNPTVYTEETITACDSYDWHGQTYTQSGDYTYTTVAANGCDSIVTLHLTINNSEIGTTEYVTICYGETYTWNGQTYSTEGEYSIVLSNVNGCDSIATLHLTISPIQYADEYITACDSYDWHGQTYTQSGDYTYTTVAANGCDSIVTLHLMINQSVIAPTEYATICHGETYTWNGQTYSAEGEYSITFSTANGCDSVATLHLTILPEAIIMEESASINEEHLPYLWHGQQCYDAGKYIDSEPFANYPYCDSVIYVLNLTVEAPNKCGDNIYWHYKNDTLTFTGSGVMYDDPDLLSYRNEPWYPERVNHIVLPNTITHIGNVAFADCANLTNILIPSSVTSIGDGAFSWTGLQSVTIPASVTNLGEQVFETCNNLHTILYEGTPNSISNQTVHPFIGCVHLDTIITPAALWHCTTADPMLEARYGVPHKARYIEVTNGELTKQAIKYIAKNSGTVEVLDLSAATNTTLPLGALLNNYRLSTLYLPDQIEVIPEMLAEGCHSLAEILIPATVTEIGNYAFAGCTNVWRMTVEAVLPPKVYDKTFDGIDRSISLIVPAGSEELYRQAEYWKEFFIDDTHSQSPISNCQKILHEDHILILREGKVYTTMGQLVK